MGVILKSVMFLLRRGPDIYETGKRITRTLAATPALTEGGAAEGAGTGRLDAVERELRRVIEECGDLSREMGRIAKEVETLRAESEATRRRTTYLMVLFAFFVGAGLVLAAAILSRFP